MKRFKIYAALFIAVVAMSTFISCKKINEPPYMNNAEIIGYDLRLCVCCGGYIVTIDNVSNPNGSAFFLVGQFPSNFVLDANPTYPVAIKLDWEVDTAKCYSNYIKILRIAKR
jgi:hypothetical protein